MWKMKNNIVCSLSFIFHIGVNIKDYFLLIPALLSLHHCFILFSSLEHYGLGKELVPSLSFFTGIIVKWGLSLFIPPTRALLLLM